MANDETIVTLQFAGATASIARLGSEPKSWKIGNQEMIWSADPKFWARSAPILFPVIGASAGGVIVVSGKSYAMPQHGFARDSVFNLVERGDNWAVLMLTDDDVTRKHYPFPFSISVRFELSAKSLKIDFEVTTGAASMPYQLGFHPAFAWPLREDRYEGCELVFSSNSSLPIFRLNSKGLLRRKVVSSVDGGSLPIDAKLIEEGALILPDSRSPSVKFTSIPGPHLKMSVVEFPQFAVWTKPAAPFLSIEAWAGLPDWDDAHGELAFRPAINLANRGNSRSHSVVLTKIA
jgi:galactose mutarotase-like enzyme